MWNARLVFHPKLKCIAIEEDSHPANTFFLLVGIPGQVQYIGSVHYSPGGGCWKRRDDTRCVVSHACGTQLWVWYRSVHYRDEISDRFGLGRCCRRTVASGRPHWICQRQERSRNAVWRDPASHNHWIVLYVHCTASDGVDQYAEIRRNE